MSVSTENMIAARSFENTILAEFVPVRAPRLRRVAPRRPAAWPSGDNSIPGVTLQIVAERLIDAVNFHPGQRVLDIAAGNGSIGLTAARRGHDVLSIVPQASSAYVAAFVARGEERAAAEQLDIEFRRENPEYLSVEDDAFDVVTSSFGATFAADQERVAHELLRASRPGGTIGLTAWAPDGFMGQLLDTIARHVPPPDDRSPSDWGTEPRLNQLFGADASTIDSTPLSFALRFSSPRQWLDLWRATFRPLREAFERSDIQTREQLTVDLLALINRFNTVSDGTVVVNCDYLEIVIRKANTPRLQLSI